MNYHHKYPNHHQYQEQQQQQQGRKRIRFSDAASSESASFDEHNNSNNNFIIEESNNDWNASATSSSSISNNNNNNFTLNLVDELRKCQREIAGLKSKDKEHAEQFNLLRAENEQLRLKLENVELKAKAETKRLVEQLEAKVAKKSGEAIHHAELRLVEFVKKWNEFHKQKHEEVETNLNDSKQAFEAKVEELHQKMGEERAEMAKQMTKLVDGSIEQHLLPNTERLDEALATVDKLWQSHAQSQQICLIETPNCHLTLGPSSSGARVSVDGLTAIKGVKGPQQHYTNFYANEPFSMPLHSSNHHSRHLYYYEVTLKKLSNIDCTFSIGLGDFGPEDGSARIGGCACPAKICLGQDGLFGLSTCYYLAGTSRQSWRFGQNFVEGDTLGCGLVAFPGGSLERQIFFTKNGQMFIEPLLVPSEVDKKLFPSVQLKGKGLIVVEANFGNNPTEKPFRWDVTKCVGLLPPLSSTTIPI